MNISRDNNSKAVLNRDKNALVDYRKSRSKRREKDNRIGSLEQRLEELEKKIDQILR